MSAAVIVKPPSNPKHCLFMPWTRTDYLYDVLHCVDQLVIPREDFEIVFYIDSDSKDLYDKLHAWSIMQHSVWNGITLVRSGNPPPPEKAVLDRRARIVHMKEDSKDYITASGYVFGIEDDTVFPPFAYARLKDIFDRRPDAGFAQGVQMNRWGLSVIGAWQVDDPVDPQVVNTMKLEAEKGTVEIDGGGFYCYLTYAELYKQHHYYWYDECFGPDMTYGLELRKLGYGCYMDLGLQCDHLTPQGKLMAYPRNVISVIWRKKGERWVRDSLKDEWGVS